MPSVSGVWSLGEAKDFHGHDESLALALASFFPKDERIWDFGCGIGFYCRTLSEAGFDVIGVEGTKGISEIAEFSPIIEADLTNTELWFSPGSVLSLEVGEHIPQNRQHDFLNLISDSTSHRAILSWAIPGQGGYHHLNEQSNAVIIEAMKSRGFSYNEEDSNELREASELWWFESTLMVFDRV